MPPGGKKGDKDSERARTDTSLRDERARTDVTERAAIDAVVHDLRSMLSAISLNAATIALAAEKGEPPQLLVDLANHIKRATAQSDLLLGDLQEIATTEDIRAIARTDADICEVVRTAVEINRAAAVASGITLTAVLPPARLVVSLDAPRFMRVVVNLVSNALKFTPVGGSVTVSLTRVADGIEVAVADTGSGIEPHERDAIFEKFWQGGNARGRGVGLGLYIAREIVRAHGGTLTVASTPDLGSTFRIHLPS